MTNIIEYIEDLEKGKATAERIYKQRKALWDRAVAAYGRSQMFESTWKDFNDRNDAIDKSARSINDALLRAAKYGDHVVEKTDKAKKAVELLAYDVRDIACQAEYLTNLMEDFGTSIKNLLGKDAKAEKCIEDFVKTIPDVSKCSLEALDKTLDLIKVASWVNESIGGNCGVNARILNIMSAIKSCGLLDNLDPDSEAVKQTIVLRGKYTCIITEAGNIADTTCGSFYAKYASSEGPSCLGKDETNFCDYSNKTKINWKKAEAKVTAARNWLNCTAEAKNTAEANYNACKAAYELAKDAQKC
jgi:hypothetical protein